MTSTPRRHALGLAATTFTGTSRFEVRRVLGEGGMGTVYEAFDRERGMLVALKTLRWLDAQGIFRFKTEFRARADLEHRNLVRLGELHQDRGHWFFTMELLEGRGFLSALRYDDTPSHDAPTALDLASLPVDSSAEISLAEPHTGRGYDERRVRAALRQLVHGLDALHRTGMVHRDLKPSNVLITHKGRLVVLDFGLVTEQRPREVSDPGVVGTAAYMAPEQAMSGQVGPAADWYSVGVMLYEALTGRLPVDGTPIEILMRKQKELPPPPHKLADVPMDLSSLCMDLLAIDPAARPTAADLLRRLAASSLATGDAPSPFVGRGRELRALEQALDDAAADATLTVCIEGESGIGKSKLVRHFVDAVARRRPDVLVLAGRCHERETVPFKGVDGVVDALARALTRAPLLDRHLPAPPETAALGQMFPVLLRVAGLARRAGALPSSPLELRARAFRGLRELLHAMAQRKTLVITIDDVQWADADSLALLGELLHAPAVPRLLLVLTRREVGGALDLPGTVRTLTLGRLDDDEAEALVQLVAPERERECKALVAGAGGHPMFLRELLRHATPLREARLHDALWARVSRLDADAQRMLELIVVAGRPLPQSLVAEALGLDARTSAKWLGVLRAASLVRTGGTRAADPVEPYHDRVRESVLSRVAPSRRRRYHERLAALLLAGGLVDKDPLAVVTHLEAAGHVDRAAELAQRAAMRGLGAVAFDQTAALCEAALRLGAGATEVDVRSALMLRRAEALACAGRGPIAAAAYLEAADLLAGDEAFQCRRAAAEQLLVSGHVIEGLQLLEDVLAALGERIPRSPQAAKRGLAWRWLRLWARGTRFVERPAGQGKRDQQLRLDVYRTASLGLGTVDPLTGATYQARAAHLALELGDKRRIAYALCYHAMYVAAAGGSHIAAARRLVAQSRAIAEECKSPFLLGWARVGEGVTEYFAGNLGIAPGVLSEGEALLREHTVGTASELNHLRMFLLWALRRSGSFDELRARYVEYLRDAIRRGDRYAATTFRWSANIVWLAADDAARARAEIDAGTWSEPEHGLHLQHWFRARARAELALYEGDRGLIAEAEAELLAYNGSVLDHVQVVRAENAIELGRIAIVKGDAAGARAALARVRRDRMPYLRAMSQLVAAAADVIDGKVERAREELEEAAALSDASGMPVLAALARRRIGQLVPGEAGEPAIAEADRVLREHGVVAPERFARAFATWPG